MKMAPFGAIPVNFQVDRHTEGFRDEPLNCAGYSVRSPSAAHRIWPSPRILLFSQEKVNAE